MQIEQHESGDVMIVRISGDITLNKGGDIRLRDKTHSLLQQGYRKILVDLGNVSAVDSSGLGQLVQAHVSAARQGASLKLLHVTRKLHDLLVVTKLLLVFDTFEQEAEALASFTEGDAARV